MHVRVQPCNLPHSFLGSSDLSLQSLTESHTLELSIHSPFLHRNFKGPSHLVAVTKEAEGRISIYSIANIYLHKITMNWLFLVVHQMNEGSHETSGSKITSQSDSHIIPHKKALCNKKQNFNLVRFHTAGA